MLQYLHNLSSRAILWGFHKAVDIERVHTKYLKQLLSVRQQTSNVCVYGETGRFLLYVYRQIRIIKYWFKSISFGIFMFFQILFNIFLSYNLPPAMPLPT